MFKKRDLLEGADVIMVKLSSFYLGNIAEARELAQDVQVATYQVSGEYAMIYWCTICSELFHPKDFGLVK